MVKSSLVPTSSSQLPRAPGDGGVPGGGGRGERWQTVLLTARGPAEARAPAGSRAALRLYRDQSTSSGLLKAPGRTFGAGEPLTTPHWKSRAAKQEQSAQVSSALCPPSKCPLHSRSQGVQPPHGSWSLHSFVTSADPGPWRSGRGEDSAVPWSASRLEGEQEGGEGETDMKAETKRENHQFTNQQRDLPAGSVLGSARGRRGRKLPRLRAPGSCPARRARG